MNAMRQIRHQQLSFIGWYGLGLCSPRMDSNYEPQTQPFVGSTK